MSKNADKNKTSQRKESPSDEKTEIKKRGKDPAPVYQYDLQGNFLREFSSRQEALNETGISQSLISLVCNGRLKSAGGYVWRNCCAPKIEVDRELYHPVYQYDLQGNFLREFSSRQQAASVVRIDPVSILRVCNGELGSYGGYVWRDYYAEKLNIGMKPGQSVYQYDLQGNFIREYPSHKEAALMNGINPASISRVCSGKCESHGGYIWRNIRVDKIDIDKRCKPVYQYDMKGNFVREYTSAKEAAGISGASASVISKVCKGKKKSCGGYIWSFRYVDKLDIDVKSHRPVYQYDMRGDFIKEYASYWDASRANSVDPSSIIKSCDDKYSNKGAGGYIWRYYRADRVEVGLKRGKPVYQYDLDGNFIKEYASRKEASVIHGLSVALFSYACQGKNRTIGGYIWRDYRTDKIDVSAYYKNPARRQKSPQTEKGGDLSKKQCASALAGEQQGRRYLTSGFNMNFLTGTVNVELEEITNLPPVNTLISVIDNETVARTLDVPCNPVDVKMQPGDVAYIVQTDNKSVSADSAESSSYVSFRYYKATLRMSKKPTDTKE